MGRCGLGEAFDDLTSLCLVFSTDILAQIFELWEQGNDDDSPLTDQMFTAIDVVQLEELNGDQSTVPTIAIYRH